MHLGLSNVSDFDESIDSLTPLLTVHALLRHDYASNKHFLQTVRAKHLQGCHWVYNVRPQGW